MRAASLLQAKKSQDFGDRESLSDDRLKNLSRVAPISHHRHYRTHVLFCRWWARSDSNRHAAFAAQSPKPCAAACYATRPLLESTARKPGHFLCLEEPRSLRAGQLGSVEWTPAPHVAIPTYGSQLGATGAGSLEICPCCGIQFGYTDMVGGRDDRRPGFWAGWGGRWYHAGMPWSSTTGPPSGWDPEVQWRTHVARMFNWPEQPESTDDLPGDLHLRP